jgi:hypothetical protein
VIAENDAQPGDWSSARARIAGLGFLRILAIPGYYIYSGVRFRKKVEEERKMKTKCPIKLLVLEAELLSYSTVNLNFNDGAN